MQNQATDGRLLAVFEKEVASRLPRMDPATGLVVEPTPMEDLTDVLRECANRAFGVDLSSSDCKVYGKLDSKIFGGSVKSRPCVEIIREAISNGRLTSGKTVFEATSGNFGLALAALGRIDVKVVALVSRKLQRGVLERLETERVKLVNLDVDICPAPGLQVDSNKLMAKGIASSVRQQLAEAGLNPAEFDRVREEAEVLLARQDVISLAKLLAKAYDGFCPEQYDNYSNVGAHEEVTGPEIDQQLQRFGESLGTFDVLCTFGTGGTATGLSRYIRATHGRAGVHVVFPKKSQEVAGIRAKDKALGLRFYLPEEYASEQEADFEKAKALLRFFNEGGHDIGESGALALYAAIGLIQTGRSRNLVVMIADGASKYGEPPSGPEARTEVTLEEAVSNVGEYAAVVWTHGALVPSEAGLDAISTALGVNGKLVRVAKVRDLQALMSGTAVPDVFSESAHNRKVLLVCMVGGTSLAVAKVLDQRGIAAESLTGGITGLPSLRGKRLLEYLRPATE